MGTPAKVLPSTRIKIGPRPPPSRMRSLLELVTGYPADPLREVGPIEAVTSLAAAVPVMRPLGALVRGEKTAAGAAKGIRAYHGSPHDFEQFALAKIGTGEGAQAYGHGLYFAENPGVAGYYKQAGVMDPRDAMSLVIARAKTYKGDDQQLRAVLKSSLYQHQALSKYGDSDDIVNDLVRVIQDRGGRGQGIRAYHGSPHDFEQFALAKIGTGEGAQVYGHGLYFAENPGVAGYYKQAGVMDPRDAMSLVIARAKTYKGDDQQLRAVLKSSLYQHQALSKYGDSDDIVNDLVRVIRGQQPDGTVTNDAIQAYRRIDKVVDEIPKGKMYEVNIKTDPEALLDWDAPLSAQSPQVRERLIEAMKKRGLPLDEHGVPLWVQRDPSGESMHAALASVGGSDREGQAAAAELLKELGIPGIRFFDRASRTAQKGTRNIVMFDDKLIDILRKYGWLPPVAGLSYLSQVGQRPQPRGPQ